MTTPTLEAAMPDTSEPTAAHIPEPYTLAEIEAKIAGHDYSAELLLQHAMLLLRARAAPGVPADVARAVRTECHRMKMTTDGRKHKELHALCDWIMAQMRTPDAAPSQQAEPTPNRRS